MAALLSLGAASRRSGLSTKALGRAIRDGRLNASRRDNWAYEIAEDELYRFTQEPTVASPGPGADAAEAVVVRDPIEQTKAAETGSGLAAVGSKLAPLFRRLWAGRARG